MPQRARSHLGSCHDLDHGAIFVDMFHELRCGGGDKVSRID
jgi:hypothetical protein